MSTLNNTTVNGVVTQTQAATLPSHLVRLGEVQAMLAGLFQGDWDDSINYKVSQMAYDAGSLYICIQTSNAGLQPSTNPSFWRLAASAGAAGASAYAYVAFASDASGGDFSMTPADGLYYMAVKSTTTPIASPVADDFTGLWRYVRGPKGDPGAGTDGDDGASSYFYIAYASDASGTGFSTTPGSGLNFVAFKTTTTPIASPSAGDFAGLWKNYAAGSITVALGGPLTLSGGGELDINASSANTASYVVKRDANGDFAMRKLTLGTGNATDHITLGAAATIGFNIDAVYFNQPIATAQVNLSTTFQIKTASSQVQFYSVSATANVWETSNDTMIVSKLKLPSITAGSVLKVGAAGIVAAATTDDLADGTTKFFFTNARVIASTLDGFVAAAGTVTAADTVLQAFQKLQAVAAGLSTTYLALAGGTLTGTLKFSGVANPGLVVNQLTSTQLLALAMTGNNGCILYDTTNNLLKAYINGAWKTITVS
jgi:hypothetical protein